MKHSPVHQRVAGLITSQGTYLGYYGFYPQSSCVLKATDQCHPSSFSFSPLPFSKIPISQNIGREGKRKKEREGEGEEKEREKEGGRERRILSDGIWLSVEHVQISSLRIRIDTATLIFYFMLMFIQYFFLSQLLKPSFSKMQYLQKE